MGYRAHHITHYEVKTGGEVGGEYKGSLTYDRLSEALDDARINYWTSEDEHQIEYESLMDFNINAISCATPDDIKIIKDLQNKASQCDYAERDGTYRVWWF